MIVISDTSPLNYLVLIRLDNLLPALVRRAMAPPAVMLELQHDASPPEVRQWAIAPPPWLEIRAPRSIDSSLNLGPGECQAIELARELHADAILIDERKGLAVARALGLFATGTLA